jgi:hypothetical protein
LAALLASGLPARRLVERRNTVEACESHALQSRGGDGWFCDAEAQVRRRKAAAKANAPIPELRLPEHEVRGDCGGATLPAAALLGAAKNYRGAKQQKIIRPGKC